MRTSVVTVALIATATVASAQWLRHPTEGVPRGRDGKPNLAAPAPRLPDGKPDFSGIWQPGRKIACTPEMSRFVECGDEIGGSPLALNMGADMPAGLPHMTKFVHTPKLLVLLNEVSAMYRQIFVDGRALPVDPNPSWNGYSTAAWEGDTLVVRTNGFRDGLWLDMSGSPMTDAAVMTERFRRHLRPARHPDHDRRPQGLHAAVDRGDAAADHARHRAHRRLPRERAVVAALPLVSAPFARS